VLARAATTTLQIIEDDGLVENARRQGERALTRLREMRDAHPLIGDVRGRGSVTYAVAGYCLGSN